MRPITRKTRLWVSLPMLAAGVLIGGALVHLNIERKRVIPVPILMFHAIDDDVEGKWVEPIADFRHTIEGLYLRGYRSILPSDLVAHQRWGKLLPKNPIIITFDDGFYDCVKNAEPILRKFGFKAICYLITKNIADTPAGRMTYTTRPCLTWEEVRAALKRGTLTFGGHSQTHPNLLAGQWEEIRGCREDIIKKTGFKADSFCYPYGRCNPEILDQVREAGFSTAMTTVDAIAHTGPELRLVELPRISMMGGRHRFHAELLTNSTVSGTFSATCWVNGTTELILIGRPRLSWPGAGESDGWLTAKAIQLDQPLTLSGHYPPNIGANDLQFEIWDEDQVLPLYTIHVAKMVSAVQNAGAVKP